MTSNHQNNSLELGDEWNASRCEGKPEITLLE